DAQWDFPLVYSIYGSQYYDGFVPGLIIVGITWGGPNPKYDSLRAADLTPTNAKQVPQSGNAPNFFAFIKTELIPFIESKFRTKKDDRTLMGSSYGGLFTLYALFQEASPFHRYVLTSPAVGFDNEVIYSFEKQYGEKRSSVPVRLFMAQGELEGGMQGFEKLVDRLKSRAYEGLKLQTRVLENIGHSGSKAEGYTRGLQWVFERPSLALDPATLKQYEGAYEISPGQRARVFVENGLLFARGPDNQVAALHAEGNDRFYAKGFYMNLRFKRDTAGTVASLEVETYNGSMSLKKVNDGL
ncbi:MAG TPA: alpha/beta hydrolase-fold protein, partial [Bacteroidota bacterium]